MSYILKALKKLEEEKAAQQARPRDINSAILTGDSKPRGSGRTVAGAAVVVLVLVSGSVSAWYFMRPTRPAADRTAGRGADQTERTTRVRQADIPSSSVPAPSEAGRKIEPRPPVAAPISPPLPQAVSRPEPRRTATARNVAAAPEPRSQRIPEPAGQTIPGLKVNGIAVQDDPSESVAIVNGMMLKRGMTIQDMRVEEIFHDRVRFAGNGQRYEVFISK